MRKDESLCDCCRTQTTLSRINIETLWSTTSYGICQKCLTTIFNQLIKNIYHTEYTESWGKISSYTLEQLITRNTKHSQKQNNLKMEMLPCRAATPTPKA